jgi:hypothetical protein
MIQAFEVKGGVLEFLEDTHTYLYDGVVLPSITQILKAKFGGKYDGIPKETLERAAERGSEVHKAIEDFEKQGIDSDLTELRNWKFLKKAYNFICLDNEVPVVLFRDDEPIAAGRLDLVLGEVHGENGVIGLGDIKRTATLDKNYLAYQLNLYRIAYQQCYNTDISFLRGVHLRNDVRKFIPLPINENLAYEVIDQYYKGV